MTYFIIIIGCQMNRADSERLAHYLDDQGLAQAASEKEADLVILTTCGIRQTAEDKAYGLINNIKKRKPAPLVVVTGCLSERADVKIRLKGKVDIWLPIKDIKLLIGKIKSLSGAEKKINSNLVSNDVAPGDYLSVAPKHLSKFSAFVPIGSGCDNFCSYCVVPYARGREKYRAAQDIISEVKGLIKNGYKEITLVAQNVNSYHSGKIGFPELLKTVNDLPSDFWLRFSTSHPKDMSLDLIKAMKESPKVCEHVHFAVQSGDDEVLKAMNRKYTVKHYISLVKKIRAALDKRLNVPAAITTDVIVGFPGETKKQFANTVKLFKELKFDLVYVSRFSPRFGTVAAKMEDDVSLDEKKRRDKKLNDILKKTALANNKKYLGKVVEVLVERKTRQGEYFGRTRTYKMVRFPDNVPGLIGQIIKVKINSAREFEFGGEINPLP